MNDVSQITNSVAQIFALITNSRETAILSAVGLLLLLATSGILYLLVRRPEVPSKSLVALLFVGLAAGVTFSAAGPFLALFWVTQQPIKSATVDQKISRLEANEEVQWLVRFIAFYPESDPDLAADKLKRLGPDRHQYTFVAPYEDLVGVSVLDAIQMTGGTYKRGQHVSAILFPLRVQLYPASARGLLQVIQAVESSPNLEIKKAFLKGNNRLSESELKDLKDTRIPSYKFANFQDKFRNYCELAHQLRCDISYSVRDYLGDIGVDWHPLGFAQRGAEIDPCTAAGPSHCKIPSWAEAKPHLQKFGTRIFLIRNLELSQIPDRVLMDFQNPAQRVVPDLGLALQSQRR